MQSLSRGSSKVNWKDGKDEFFVIQTLQADAGPTARVVQLAVALFRRRELAWSHSTLLRRPAGVDFEAPWVKGAMDAHGIDTASLDAAAPFEDVLQRELSCINCPVWVGYDLRSEFKALARERAIAEDRLGQSLSHLVPSPKLHVSVSDLASVLHPLLGRGLGEMCKRYNIAAAGSSLVHKAEATGRVLCAMMDKLPDRFDAMANFAERAGAEASRVRARHGARRW